MEGRRGEEGKVGRRKEWEEGRGGGDCEEGRGENRESEEEERGWREGASRASEDTCSGRNVVEYAQVIGGKNEVTLEFHQAENAPLSMIEIRFMYLINRRRRRTQ